MNEINNAIQNDMKSKSNEAKERFKHDEFINLIISYSLLFYFFNIY
jgi:hypothetical protein